MPLGTLFSANTTPYPTLPYPNPNPTQTLFPSFPSLPLRSPHCKHRHQSTNLPHRPRMGFLVCRDPIIDHTLTHRTTSVSGGSYRLLGLSEVVDDFDVELYGGIAAKTGGGGDIPCLHHKYDIVCDLLPFPFSPFLPPLPCYAMQCCCATMPCPDRLGLMLPTCWQKYQRNR